MKYVIASDIHGSAKFADELMAAFAREQGNRLLLLGDLLYHGPRNDLPENYSPKDVASLLNTQKDRILCVRGNCEAEVDQLMLDFPILAEYCLIETFGHLIFVTHGHKYNLNNPPALHKSDILLHGHTHIPANIETQDGWKYLNPGSISIPKENSVRGYMTLESGLFLWKDLSGHIYDRLDIAD